MPHSISWLVRKIERLRLSNLGGVLQERIELGIGDGVVIEESVIFFDELEAELGCSVTARSSPLAKIERLR